MTARSRPPGARPRLLGATLLLLCGGLVPPVGAETTARLPQGLPLGPWVLAPSLEMSWEADNNVFRREDDDVGRSGSDTITRTTGVLDAFLPLRNGMLELGYRGSRVGYRDNEFSRDVTHNFSGELSFLFSSGDELTLKNDFALDFSDVQRTDEGGERVFDGRSFRLNRWQIELSRQEFRQPGYSVRVGRRDLGFERSADEAPPFFEYRGFEHGAEYRHPLAGEKWAVAVYDRRRFDHFNGRRAGSVTVVDPVGQAYRREETDTLQLGLRGATGRAQPFLFSVGYGRFRYDGLAPGVRDSEYDGVVGQARWDPTLGSRTRLELQVLRRALPSNFDTYYVNHQARAQIAWEWLAGSEAGIRARFDYNRYGDLISLEDCEDFIRRDRSRYWTAYGEWRVKPSLALGVEYQRQARNSNCETVEYKADVVSANFVLGWF